MFARILTIALALTIGVGAGIGWEHRGPQRFPLSILGASLALQRDQARAALKDAETARDGWKSRADACAAARMADHDRAAAAVDQAEQLAEARSGQAWTVAYRAGRVAGARICKGPNDESPPPGDGAGLRPRVGVRDDFATAFNAAGYRPADDLPARADGALAR